MAGRHVQKKSSSRAEEWERSRQTQDSSWDYGTPEENQEEAYDNYEAYDEYETYRRGGGRPWLKWAIPVLAVLVLVVAGLVYTMVYANRLAGSDTIYPNVSVNGVSVGGMTVEEAAQTLQAAGANPYQGKSITVHFPLDYTLTVTAEELGFGADATVPAEAAYAYGRSGSAVENLKSYLSCKTTPVEMQWDVNTQLDEETLRQKVDAVANQVNTQLLESEAQIGDEGITLIKGMSTATVDADSLCSQIRAAFLERDFSDIECELVDTQSDGDSAQEVLQSVYDTVYTEPVNAMYDKETGGATESQRGVSFDMELACQLWDEAETGDEIFIPFVFTEPDIDAETLLSRLFADKLSSKSTTLSGSSSNRINNVTLAAAALNDTVINPGETFDYNTCLGQRTTERGYKEAGVYVSGKHSTDVGGGICQDSSTLYYCALYANLQITVRDNHYFVVSYLPWGLDATVSWGGPDFRFVNNRDYPIKLKAWVSDGYLTVEIWGTDVDGSYVQMTSDTWEDDDYYYAQTYRAVYAADGTLLSKEKEAYSRYHKYEAGEETPAPETASPTATAAPTASPTPTDTPPTAQPTENPTPAESQTPVATQTPVENPTPVETPVSDPTPDTPANDPTPDNSGTGSGGDSGGTESGGDTSGTEPVSEASEASSVSEETGDAGE
jgi:vancomycin resistance protein YoaR